MPELFYLRRRVHGWTEYLCWDGEAGAFVEFPSERLAFIFTRNEAETQDPKGEYEWLPI